MRVFIVRPFREYFDRVERELIAPVLKELDLEGSTTAEVVKAGNIRLDMFQKLLIADIVIADVSTHNANVYYELGIRHALRDKKTILIRCKTDDIPFDLRTDRYLEYPKDDPASIIPKLVKTVKATMESSTVDSPVYLLLPKLKAQDPSCYQAIPINFRDAVTLAEQKGDSAILGLLGEEIRGMEWEIPGRRLVGRALFNLKAYYLAKCNWEAILKIINNDVEANQLLGTIYQRLNDLSASTMVINRVLKQKDLPQKDRAEAHALIARNHKTRWLRDWEQKAESERTEAALKSSFLYDAISEYRSAFMEDQNHYYSGVNALGLYTVVILLADRKPDIWKSRFDSDDKANSKLETLKEQKCTLSAAVGLSLEAARKRCHREGSSDLWLDLSFANFQLLTSDRPDFVSTCYNNARARLIERLGRDTQKIKSSFPADSEAKQIGIYLNLGILLDNSRAALVELGVPESRLLATQENKPAKRNRIILFTGHRIDALDRPKEKIRFPAEFEEVARNEIRKAVSKEKEKAEGVIVGIAGAASGGDILFHEVCGEPEIAIETSVLLAMAPNEYSTRSVQDAGPEWVERFRDLLAERNIRILSESGDLPSWLDEKNNYSVWNRNNLWILYNALAERNTDVTLIALWDGKDEGDGPGGTVDMIRLAEESGVKLVLLNTRKLFGLA